MVKKFLATVVLVVTLIFAGAQTNTAEAREVFMGYYSDGSAVYLLTETIEESPRNTSYAFTCTVRAGRDYLKYGFEYDGRGGADYNNSEGYRGNINDGRSPVARAIWNYWKNR